MKICPKGPAISHLFLANDTLLFCKAKLEEVQCVKEILRLYEQSSGQKVNLDKSAVFFSKNTGETARSAICKELEGIVEQRNSKYLGLPMVIGRSKKQVFNFVKEKVLQRVNNWKNQLLSSGGKEVLLKSVPQALPVYCMSCFKLPKGLCDELAKVMSSFW